MLKIDNQLQPADLMPAIRNMWEASAPKIRAIEESCPPGTASPVFTVDGTYTARGWTEWTQGFQYGSAILQFDATGDEQFLELGRERTVKYMAPHVTHTGVHDHGFNNVSTYGNLRRLMLEGRIPHDRRELDFYELAIKCSGAVQAARWTRIHDGTGYITSFNGPHSLFADTIRSLRALVLAHTLGQVLQGENDVRLSLLQRAVEHAANTSRYNVYFGTGRDAYDIRGRVAHESIFNTRDGNYRCPNSQQGFSPFTTWTRGLAWIVLGCAEQLEFFAALEDEDLPAVGGRAVVLDMLERTATATCDFYIEHAACSDGIPYWDTGAPNLHLLDDWGDRPAEPFNDWEPVDSSAAAIACQGLMRLGRYMMQDGREADGKRYFQAGLTVLRTLLQEPYLESDARHQGLILHSIYHRPNGWDRQPPTSKIPAGEASMWGDYHAREAALYVQRLAEDGPYYTFFGPPAQA